MTTSLFVTNHRISPDKVLLNDVYREIIQFAGIDTMYAPRTNVAIDPLYGEDPVSKFEVAYDIEMYLESSDGHGGTDNIAKFGLEIPDTATMILHKERFQLVSGLDKPLAGDLIYIPLSKGLFEIKFVEDEIPFFALADNYSWKLEIELFQYSQEQLDTGVVGIDRVEDTLNNADDASNDPFADNDAIETEGINIIDFSEDQPFSESM